MKRILITCILCGLVAFGFSQSPSKVENIKKMLELSGAGKLGIQVAENMLTSFTKSLPDVPKEFWDDFKKQMNPEDINNLVIPVYDKYYTDSDIQQLIDFYQTPIGKKSISVAPQIMKESMEAGQIWGKMIGEKVLANLKAKGYLKE